MEGNEWPCLEVEVVEYLHGRLQRRRPPQARVQTRRGGVVVVVVGGGGSGHGECGWCAVCAAVGIFLLVAPPALSIFKWVHIHKTRDRQRINMMT
jgi:hypothetical protein